MQALCLSPSCKHKRRQETWAPTKVIGSPAEGPEPVPLRASLIPCSWGLDLPRKLYSSATSSNHVAVDLEVDSLCLPLGEMLQAERFCSTSVTRSAPPELKAFRNQICFQPAQGSCSGRQTGYQLRKQIVLCSAENPRMQNTR